MISESKGRNNHFVQQALQRRFALPCESGDMKIQCANIQSRDGWTMKIKKNMSRSNLYTDEIEELFRMIEKDFVDVMMKILSSKKGCTISRLEFNTIKKYFLLQRYRTPSSLKTIEDINERHKEKDDRPLFTEEQKPNETDYEYWLRILELVLRTSWEELPDCSHSVVRSEVRTLNRMHPLFVETRSGLILPDSGVGHEDVPFAPGSMRKYTTPERLQKTLEDVRGRDYSEEDAKRILSQWNMLVSSMILPIDDRHALILVEDIIAKAMINDLQSPLKSKLLPGLRYNTRVEYQNISRSTKTVEIETIQNQWSPDDMIHLTRQIVDCETTNAMNLISLDSCDCKFCFKDLEGIQPFIHDNVLVSARFGRISECLSFMDSVDFTKDMPKEERTSNSE